MSAGRLYILFYLLAITTFIQVDAKIVARATCDDDMYFYADGVLMANDSDWTRPTQIDLPDNTTVLGVRCVNGGGIAGIHVTYTLKKTYTTDTSWKCSAKFEENWSAPGFEDGNWNAASIVYETMYYRTNWIWTAGYNGEDKEVYCRKKIKAAPIIRKITSDAVDNTVDEHSSVTISCLVESFPVARVSWSRKRKGGQLYSGSQYTIPKASCQDTDNYTCTAGNKIGQPVSETIPLYVRCTPVVTTKHVIVIITKDVIVVPRGETVILPINVVAYPLPVFAWYYHSQDGHLQPVTMVTGSRSKQTNNGLSSKLTIQNIKYEDGGDYTVNITNSMGTTSKTYTVSVIPNDDNPSKGDKLINGIAIGFGVGLVVAGVLYFIIWGIRKRRNAINSNDKNDVNDTVSSQSRDITTRNNSVDTGDSGECGNGVNETVISQSRDIPTRHSSVDTGDLRGCGNGVNDRRGSQSTDISTRHWNSPVDTGDLRGCGKVANDRRGSQCRDITTRQWNNPVDTGDLRGCGNGVNDRRASQSRDIPNRHWNSPGDTDDSRGFRRGSQSRDITTRQWNNPGDTGDSGIYVNTRRDSRSSFYEVLGELAMKHQSNNYR